ncbi:hypothetical protein K435DRAFT_35145 [Dendrothele bispora CBS 962.96]|uniref:Uncharacterized protein n=1 Tax=Dendrothele bispora (strain CBS 962.96) TaxID=1314807 RepID=A0A4S8M7C6_DENBC|nr:hypothetical protein K435DRAFT_35145 [Dendrothele bispora CBS 962.96]
MSYGDQGTYDDMHPEYHHHDGHHYQHRVPMSSSHPAEYDHAMFHLPRPSFNTFVQSNYPQHQLSYHQNYQNMEFSYDPNYVPSYPSSSSYPPQRLTPPSHPRSQSQQLPSPAEASQRLPLAGSLDPSTGIFYRTPEHPRLRTAQACEKCRTRKAKVRLFRVFVFGIYLTGYTV